MEEEKSKKGLYIGLIIFLLLCLVGSGFFIYKRIYADPVKDDDSNISNEEKEMTVEEAKALGKEMFIKYYDFMKNHPTMNTYGSLEEYKQYNTGGDLLKKLSEDGLAYNSQDNGYFYLSDNFEDKFYSVFAKEVKINDIFHNESDKESNGVNYRYALIDNKYYVDIECRASGLIMKLGDFTINNQTHNIINYSFIVNESGGCPSENNCDSNSTKEMQIIKEDDVWKINKISEFTTCELLENNS